MAPSGEARAFLWGTAAGAAAAGLGYVVYMKWKARGGASGHSRADWSMFWGYEAPTGRSVAPVQCSEEDEGWLRVTRPEYKRIPKEVYGTMVQDAIITCVDIVLVRPDGHTLLVRRGMEPVKDFWWYPGGRMFKGETFFDTAVRKAKEETGLDVTPIKVLGVWNTFFPTSSWDGPGEGGRKGTQTVNAVVACEVAAGAEIQLDDTSEEHEWVPMAMILAKGEAAYDRYVVEPLRLL